MSGAPGGPKQLSLPDVRALLIAVVMMLGTTSALAKPKVAVAPIKGDTNDQLGNVLVDVLSEKTRVVGPVEVERAIAKLGFTGALEPEDVGRLEEKLGVSALIQGKLKKDGKRKSLQLIVTSRGGKQLKFTVKFKSAASDRFRDNVREELVKRIEAELAAEPPPEEVTGKSRRERDRDRARKDQDGDVDKDKDDDEPRRKRKDKDKDKEVAERDDEDAAPRKRKRRSLDDDEDEGTVIEAGGAARTPMTQPAARVDAGLTFALRKLSWSAGAMGPPNVSTPGPSGRIEGEIYPLALANPKSPLRGLGLAAKYDKSFANSIAIPNTATQKSVDQAHYAVGVRYRIEVGEASSVALGLDYARRHTIVSRTGLMPNALDMPDVDYKAFAPNAGGRVPLTPKITAFADFAFLAITQTGPIQTATSYGFATVYGIEGTAGVDIGLTKQLALRVAGELAQISFAFKKGQGTLAMTRNVDSATDRSLGLAATLAVVY
jgi:hypothetical protein